MMNTQKVKKILDDAKARYSKVITKGGVSGILVEGTPKQHKYVDFILKRSGFKKRDEIKNQIVNGEELDLTALISGEYISTHFYTE